MIRVFLVLSILVLQTSPAAAQTSPVWPRDPAPVRAACANTVNELNGRLAAIASRSGGFTFANTVLPLENAVSDARDRVASERFMWTVAQDDALIDASRQCATSMRQTLVDVLANPRLSAAVSRVAIRPPHDAYDRALTFAWADRLKRGGGAVAGPRHDRYTGLAHELVRVEDAFWRNLARDRTTIRIDRRQARGLSADLTTAFTRNGDGSFAVPVDAGTLSFLRFETDADARKAFYRAYNRRAAAANVPLLERAIGLRDRIAHALGVVSWADYRLRATTLGGSTQAQRFLASGASTYAAGRPPEGIAPWDLLREAGESAAPRSTDDALDAIGSALGLRFVRGTETAWAAGVAPYDVVDASSQRTIGRLYIDLARRSGKQTGDGAYVILTPRGNRPGSVAIVASWPGRSSSISGDRLVDFYRLAGRAMTLLLPAVPYETLARATPDAQQTVAAVFERFAQTGGPSAREMLEQIALAQIDLAFGSSGSHVDTSVAWQRAAAATFAPLYDPGTYPQVASDDFAGEEAGLRALRPWGETYAADLYGMLAVDGRFDPKSGERFRRTVLAPGAARRFEDEMRDFLGRQPHAATP